MATAQLEQFLREQAPVGHFWPRRARLIKTIRDLRGALERCAQPEVGWPDTFCADVYEESRRVVPDSEDN